jgi:uncharacterized protein YecT (DUF1311 family)
MIRALSIMLALTALPASAQDLRFSDRHTEQCLASTSHAGNPADCIGTSAMICMEQPGGESTYGMGFCLDREVQFWDRQLNTTYQQLRAAMQDADRGLPSHLAVQASSLRDMQRAWIAYRDARCGHEAATWQGGTGAGPAFASCLMHLTGEQALYLSALLSGEG